jgi:DNA polymerase-3 subunit beta
MKVYTKEFLKELEWAARFIEKKSTIPVLQNILLDARECQLWMTGTDLETAAQTFVGSSDDEQFKVTVPVHSLLKYLKKVEETRLDLTPVFTTSQEFIVADESDPSVEGPREMRTIRTATGLTVAHGENEVTLEGIAASQYPELPAAPFDAIELAGLSVGVPRATLAISREESRFTLNGALLEIKDGYAKLVATDGHRLSVVELHTDAHKLAKFKVLIGEKTLAEIARFSDRCLISKDDNHVFITAGHRSILGRILTGSFPDYERVMPRMDDLKYIAQVDTAKLQKTLERVQVFSDERSRGVRLMVTPGTMELSSCTSDQGKASGKVPANWIEFEGAFASFFNASYILDFVKAAKSDTVNFSFDDPTRAAQWSVIGGWQYVVMPMRAGECERPYAERDARNKAEAEAAAARMPAASEAVEAVEVAA